MLLWFRNDLRIHDNPALYYLLQQRGDHTTEAQAIYFLSRRQWREHGYSDIKLDFSLRHLAWLKQELSKYRVRLVIVECPTYSDQIDYLCTYAKEHNNPDIVINRELEFNERSRDQLLQARGLNLVSFESDVIVPKGQVLNSQRQMFKVFTPFKKAWLAYVRQFGFDYIARHDFAEFKQVSLATEQSNKPSPSHSLSQHWPLISHVELTVIPAFLSDKLNEYAADRDFPAIKGTSGLSPYLAIGALSPRYLMTLLLNRHPDLLAATDHKAFAWLNELIWREFYRHLMFHFPKLSKERNFNAKYDAINWRNNKTEFKAWCDGKTGYPIVDAAMRQLNQTGWMHNRLRMVVASFLTKHLLIDWRWGERYFMSKLIDGDLAANNGGWQWAASTGCDAQPYFRIFNPIRQSERFDPNGTFIRKYLPELQDVPDKQIHFPHLYLDKHKLDGYWPAVVEHKAARELALSAFKAV